MSDLDKLKELAIKSGHKFQTDNFVNKKELTVFYQTVDGQEIQSDFVFDLDGNLTFFVSYLSQDM
jgi:hypothetical protein